MHRDAHQDVSRRGHEQTTRKTLRGEWGSRSCLRRIVCSPCSSGSNNVALYAPFSGRVVQVVHKTPEMFGTVESAHIFTKRHLNYESNECHILLDSVR